MDNNDFILKFTEIYENLHNYQEILYKNEIEHNIIQNLNRIINHKNIIERYKPHKKPNIEVLISNDYSINAHAIRLPNKSNNYNIVLNYGLILFIRECSICISKYYDFSWKPNINENNKLNAENQFSDVIMYFLIQAIGYHEFSHIIMGHVGPDSFKENRSINKIYFYFKEALLSRACEYEADKYANQFIFAEVSTIEFKNSYFSYQKQEDKWKDFAAIIYFLHILLSVIGNNKSSIFATHPSPLVRAELCQPMIFKAILHFENKGFFDKEKSDQIRNGLNLGFKKINNLCYGYYGFSNKLKNKLKFKIGYYLYPIIIKDKFIKLV